MKQAKRPTREQKEIMSEAGLVPENWNVITDNKAEMEVISKRSGQRRTVAKKARKKHER